MKFPKSMNEFEDILIKTFRAGMTAGENISHSEEYQMEEMTAAIKYCEESGFRQYGRLVYPPGFTVKDGYCYEMHSMETPEKVEEKIKKMHRMQQNTVEDTYDNGYYNGIEYCLSLLENRDARYRQTR